MASYLASVWFLNLTELVHVSELLSGIANLAGESSRAVDEISREVCFSFARVVTKLVCFQRINPRTSLADQNLDEIASLPILRRLALSISTKPRGESTETEQQSALVRGVRAIFKKYNFRKR